jgi:peptidoglycan/LPS O-acetylase OafA/YrhL
MATLAKQEIIDALTRLGELLDAQGQTCELLLIGGSAMVLAFDVRQSTRDVDVVVLPPSDPATVVSGAKQVALERGWPDDWLNDAAKGFVGGLSQGPVLLQQLQVAAFLGIIASGLMLIILLVAFGKDFLGTVLVDGLSLGILLGVLVIWFAVMLGLIAAAARGPDWDVAALRLLRRPIAWLAGISYGVYLVHQQLGFVLARVLVENGFGGWSRLVLVFAAAVVAGWALTVLVERPAHRWLTRRRRQRPAVASDSRATRGDSAAATPAEATREPETVGGRS